MMMRGNCRADFLNYRKSLNPMSFPHALSGNPGFGLDSGSPIKTFGDDTLECDVARKRRGARSSNNKGVTLIELVMAIVIMTAISIPTAYMIGGQVRGMAETSDLSAAGNAARLAMERLNNIPYASVTDGGSIVVGYYTVNWGVVETPVGGGAVARKDITMTVHRTGDAANLLTLYGSITNNVTYAP
jgi:prepilin-type N-terminal cleavage/methylation domain-containing protein